MKYVEYNFNVESPATNRDILLAELSELPFENFEETDLGLKAYIPELLLDKNKVSEFIHSKNYILKHTVTEIEDVNWNNEWEKEYQPIIVENQCLIRAPFHPDDPGFIHEVIIKPQMSFGTGHHDTTYLMVKHLLNENIYNKSVLDMGCGTGVLAILSELKSADPIWAIDIDEWAYKNTVSNCLLNGTENVSVKFGGVEAIPDRKFDIILANINKNVLKKDMATYVKHLKKGASLFISGFFEVDVEEMKELLEKHKLKVKRVDVRDEWALIKCVK